MYSRIYKPRRNLRKLLAESNTLKSKKKWSLCKRQWNEKISRRAGKFQVIRQMKSPHAIIIIIILMGVNCLAFADDLAILSKGIETAKEQINILKTTAEKTGLLISFEKTEYMTNIKDAPHYLHTNHGEIKKVDKFKYLGEIIQKNGLEKEANKARTRKMEFAYQSTKNMYCISCIVIVRKPYLLTLKFVTTTQ
uniref:Reverse transcriptase domain-containing protein n=1 Tax=Cacopsylla melanoneura TaxID=428564 RepID=A0A8D8ZXX3_9HEMI